MKAVIAAAIHWILLHYHLFPAIHCQSDKRPIQFKIKLTENEHNRKPLIDLSTKLAAFSSSSSSSTSTGDNISRPQYTIISGNQQLRNLIQLNSRNGKLTLISSIDREELCSSKESECSHTLIISYGSQIIELILSIIDRNDEYPIFNKQDTKLYILEDAKIGSKINLPLASDLDSPKFGIHSYHTENYNSISNGIYNKNIDKYFKLLTEKDNTNVIRPYLQIMNKLDREKFDKFLFTLVAMDTKGKKGKINIILYIKDVNDNNPQWIGLPYKVVIEECTKRREIFQLKATDPDDPNTINSKLEYEIDFSKSNDPKLLKRQFYISGQFVVLIDGSLKGLAETVILLPVKVTDGGGLENSTSVKIYIKDCNDHAPAITMSGRTAKVSENQNRSTILSFVTVNDEDLNLNCDFSCHLNDTSYLNLKVITQRPLSTKNDKVQRGMMQYYQIETRSDRSFDREEIDYYSVMITCADKGTPVLRSYQQYNIIIQDQNDNVPTFTKSIYEFSLWENMIATTEVGVVSAPDKDVGNNARIQYSLSNEGDKYFSINDFGVITSRQSFDREVRDFYNFTVIAKDHGERPLSSSAKINIKILDTNDCKPRFKENYHFSIVESYSKTTIHSYLGTVEATDDDLNVNGKIWYRIVDKDPYYSPAGKVTPKSYTVQITKSGKLTIYGIVDREVENSIFIDVMALDNGKTRLSTITTVTVTILDLNDNKPEFVFPKSSSGSYVNVSLENDSGSLIAKLEAYDKDNGVNGTVSFELVGNKTLSPVYIEKDGRVFLKDDIKKIKKELTYSDRILVRASDSNKNHPNSEVGSLILRYIWPSKSDSYSHVIPRENNEQENTDVDQDSEINRDYFYDNKVKSSYSSNYIIVLYCLAAVVFIVFLSVLCVLIYFYSAGRTLNGSMGRKSTSKPSSCKMQAVNNQSDYFESIPFDTATTGLNSNNIYGFQSSINNKTPESSYMQLMNNVPCSSTNIYNPLTMFTTSIPTYLSSPNDENPIIDNGPGNVGTIPYYTSQICTPVIDSGTINNVTQQQQQQQTTKRSLIVAETPGQQIKSQGTGNTVSKSSKNNVISSILKRKQHSQSTFPASSSGNCGPLSHSLSSMESGGSTGDIMVSKMTAAQQQLQSKQQQQQQTIIVDEFYQKPSAEACTSSVVLTRNINQTQPNAATEKYISSSFV